jgi:putative transposase
MTFVKWLPLLSHTEIVNILISSLAYLQNEKGLVIYGWVFMENHIHLIVKSENLSKTILSFKSFTARKIIDHLETLHMETILSELYWGKTAHKRSLEFQVWQEGFHPEEISSREMMLQKLEYTHNNPVKRGYVRKAEHWRYSSMASYLGDSDELLDVHCRW